MKLLIATLSLALFCSSFAFAEEQECTDTMSAIEMASAKIQSIDEQLMRGTNLMPDQLRVKKKNWNTISKALYERMLVACPEIKAQLMHQLGKTLGLQHNFMGTVEGGEGSSSGSVMDYNPPKE